MLQPNLNVAVVVGGVVVVVDSVDGLAVANVYACVYRKSAIFWSEWKHSSSHVDVHQVGVTVMTVVVVVVVVYFYFLLCSSSIG